MSILLFMSLVSSTYSLTFHISSNSLTSFSSISQLFIFLQCIVSIFFFIVIFYATPCAYYFIVLCALLQTPFALFCVLSFLSNSHVNAIYVCHHQFSRDFFLLVEIVCCIMLCPCIIYLLCVQYSLYTSFLQVQILLTHTIFSIKYTFHGRFYISNAKGNLL